MESYLCGRLQGYGFDTRVQAGLVAAGGIFMENTFLDALIKDGNGGAVLRGSGLGVALDDSFAHQAEHTAELALVGAINGRLDDGLAGALEGGDVISHGSSFLVVRWANGNLWSGAGNAQLPVLSYLVYGMGWGWSTRTPCLRQGKQILFGNDTQEGECGRKARKFEVAENWLDGGDGTFYSSPIETCLALLANPVAPSEFWFQTALPLHFNFGYTELPDGGQALYWIKTV